MIGLRNTGTLLVLLLCVACAPVVQKKEPVPPAASHKPVPPAEPPIMHALASNVAPDRDRIRGAYRYRRSINATDIAGLDYFFYEPDGTEAVVGFSLLNDGSKRINPVGIKRHGPLRKYTFLFADRAREDIHLTINDDVRITDRFSHDNMYRELHFFPRRQLPSIHRRQRDNLLEVTLPTGEAVLFDQQSLELVDGVLSEQPIDFNRDRHRRKNPGVTYKGDYLAISVAQRGESPRRDKVWGQTKYAEVFYPSRYKRPCRLSPKLIWDQRPKKGDIDPKLTMLHMTDETIFATVERQCGWDLAELRNDSRQLASHTKP